MREKLVILPVLTILLSFSILLAQEDNKEEPIPPGMERIKVGRGSEVIVPAGTKTHKVGDLIVLENPGEYVARRIGELDGKIAKIEEENQALRQKIEKLEAQLIGMHNALLKSEGKANK